MQYFWSDPQSRVLFCYLLFNFLTFLLASYDKYVSRLHKAELRVPERVFFLLGFFGGAAGILFAMLLWRHKTRHTRFLIFFPLFSLCQAGLLIFWVFTRM